MTIADWFRGLFARPPGAVVAEGPKPPEPAFPPLSPTDRDVLIRTVYGEARGEGEAGQAAVVHTIRNRLARPKRFRPTVAGICQQPWQFSCWLTGDPNLARMNALRSGGADYERIGAVVDRAWAEPDSVGGADHYFASYIVRPRWAEPPARETARIGVHRFYAGVA